MLMINQYTNTGHGGLTHTFSLEISETILFLSDLN